jgi:hypothetical protein
LRNTRRGRRQWGRRIFPKPRFQVGNSLAIGAAFLAQFPDIFRRALGGLPVVILALVIIAALIVAALIVAALIVAALIVAALIVAASIVAALIIIGRGSWRGFRGLGAIVIAAHALRSFGKSRAHFHAVVALDRG